MHLPTVRNVLALLVLLPLIPTLRAQTAGTGVIEGRVLNVTSGAYLNNARITIAGTRLETFSNESGEYRLANVPPGEAQVVAAFTGLRPQTAAITVRTDQVARHDFNLTRG